MQTLLHLDTSIRTDGSRSRRLSSHFAEYWQQDRPQSTVIYRDLAADPLPHLDAAAVAAAHIPAEQRTAEHHQAHALNEALINELLSAATVVIGMPLYNFGTPSTFKAWFDRIVSEQHTIGKLTDRRFVVATSSGGGYRPGTPREGWDHREPWLRHALSTLGVSELHVIGAELTLARESPAMIPLNLGDAEDQSMDEALKVIEKLAAA